MSTALPLDLDLDKLRGAHDAVGTTILELAELASRAPDCRLELSDAIFRLSDVRVELELAINACDGEPKEGGSDG